MWAQRYENLLIFHIIVNKISVLSQDLCSSFSCLLCPINYASSSDGYCLP